MLKFVWVVWFTMTVIAGVFAVLCKAADGEYSKSLITLVILALVIVMYIVLVPFI